MRLVKVTVSKVMLQEKKQLHENIFVDLFNLSTFWICKAHQVYIAEQIIIN